MGKIVFPTNELRQLDSHMKKDEEWIIDLYIRAKAIKLLEENIKI